VTDWFDEHIQEFCGGSADFNSQGVDGRQQLLCDKSTNKYDILLKN
jgi:hypothetical protein